MDNKTVYETKYPIYCGMKFGAQNDPINIAFVDHVDRFFYAEISDFFPNASIEEDKKKVKENSYFNLEYHSKFEDKTPARYEYREFMEPKDYIPSVIMAGDLYLISLKFNMWIRQIHSDMIEPNNHPEKDYRCSFVFYSRLFDNYEWTSFSEIIFASLPGDDTSTLIDGIQYRPIDIPSLMYYRGLNRKSNLESYLETDELSKLKRLDTQGFTEFKSKVKLKDNGLWNAFLSKAICDKYGFDHYYNANERKDENVKHYKFN